MKIFVNGSEEAFVASLNEIIERRGYTDPRAVATAVNGVFVSFSQRATIELKENDKIEILQPMSGG